MPHCEYCDDTGYVVIEYFSSDPCEHCRAYEARKSYDMARKTYAPSKLKCDSCGKNDVWDINWLDMNMDGGSWYEDALCYDCGRYVGTSGMFCNSISFEIFKTHIDEVRPTFKVSSYEL